MANKIDTSKNFATRLNKVYMGEYPTYSGDFAPVEPYHVVLGKIQLGLTRDLYSLFLDLHQELNRSSITGERRRALNVDMNVVYRLWWQQAMLELGHPDMNDADARVISVREGWTLVGA